MVCEDKSVSACSFKDWWLESLPGRTKELLMQCLLWKGKVIAPLTWLSYRFMIENLSLTQLIESL